jgi:ERCC4-related helicase
MGEFLPGTQVVARGLRWEVVVSLPLGEEQSLLRLRALDGALRGGELELLHPFEAVEPVVQEFTPSRAAPLQHWRLYHQGFLLEQELGPMALLAAQPGRLSPAPYQLVPLMRMLRMSRPRLLLADGVGLGKTIEAGLVLVELIARRRAHRVLVVSPPGPLLDQWRRELRERFGLRFVVLDSDSIADIRRRSELGANPFDVEALGLISIDFAKQEKVLQELERSQFDVVVIDEAHHVARVGSAGTGEDSQRRRLAEVLASRSDGLLLLSATPHDGFDAHFASLVELLDPSLVNGRGELRGDAYRRAVVRRLKRHVKGTTGGLAYDDRRVIPSRVEVSPATHPAWARYQQGLLALLGPQLRKAFRNRRFGDVLAFIALLKRSVSSLAASRSTLEVVIQRLTELESSGAESMAGRAERLGTLREYRRRLERFGALSWEEEQDQAALEAEDIAGELATADAALLDEWLAKAKADLTRARRSGTKVTSLKEGLESLVELARDAEGEDPKLSALLTELQAIRSEEPGANVLVYTEYADSQNAVVAALKAAVERGALQGAVLQISGLDSERVRSEVTLRFSTQDGLVLVSTDATAEGLNLHARCHHLIHLELPYNPNRLEQRNGRIDRFGQKQQPVVRYLYLPGTFEERLLLRLVHKFERQRSRLSFVPNTLGISAGELATSEGLLKGLVDEDQKLFAPAPLEFSEGETEDTSTTAYRELLAELDRAIGTFDKTTKAHDWLGLRGIAADPHDVDEAVEAQQRGVSLTSSVLTDFVCDAVESEGARVQRRGDLVEVHVPSNWSLSLGDLPGWDEEAEVLRLTTNVERTADERGRSLGFLGRAHPLVRRALDRARRLQFGGSGSLDPRVSVATFNGSGPAVLWTWLGQVRTVEGRELERLIATRVDRDGAVTVLEPNEWFTGLAAIEHARETSGAWREHFEVWAPASRDAAFALATEHFEAAAGEVLARLVSELEIERRLTSDWFANRVHDLCGPPQLTQDDLFGGASGDLATWKRSLPALERLSAFATDHQVGARLRREAEGVLRLYKSRLDRLAAREHAQVTKLTPVGLLLLVPESS